MKPSRPALLLCFLSLGVFAQEIPKPRVIPETTEEEVIPKPNVVPETVDPAPPPMAEPAPPAPVLTPEPAAEAPIKPKIIPEEQAEPKQPPKPVEEPKPDVAVKARAVGMDNEPLPAPKIVVEEEKPQIKISSKNDKLARTLILTVPPPRGQIIDRNGEPLAQNKMAHFLGVQFPLKQELQDGQVLAYANLRIAEISKRTGDQMTVAPDKILEHYKNRRWLPLLAARPIPEEATEAKIKALPEGIVAQPCYLRHYPNGQTACHSLGQMGRREGMPTSLIQNGDSLWPFTEGRNGMESKFETILAGTPGKVNIVFSATGDKISEELIEAPIPGDTVVSTLDIFMQETCERALRASDSRSAMAIIDIHTGDVVALASNPGYDPNLFSFGIRTVDYEGLEKNKNKPLFPRATMGLYPPASTFKVLTALAVLESGKVAENKYYDCPNRYYVGDRFFYNWNRASGEGSMNVIGALKRSCNTWFYQAAIASGATPITSMAVRFGLGQRTGVPVPEAEGLMPTPEWWRIKRRHDISRGDLANICIGQGDTTVTPLQVALMMSGIARETSLPKLRMVSQIQATDGTIVEFFPPEDKADLQLTPAHLNLVQKGLRAVVADSNGTGKAAANKYVPICGKTGTGQNGSERGLNRYVAWFAGYIPFDNPQYAYAALCEGEPGGSQISGGKKVAPIVGSVFNQIYARKKLRGESMSGPPTAVESAVTAAATPKSTDGDSSETTVAVKKPRRPKTAAAAPTAAAEGPTDEPAPESGGGLRWLFRKLGKKE